MTRRCVAAAVGGAFALLLVGLSPRPVNSQTAPAVTQFELTWDTVVLLCSDGLTRHVSDDRIRDRLRSMTSAKQACEALVQDALEGGGSDNVTVVVRRALPSEG